MEPASAPHQPLGHPVSPLRRMPPASGAAAGLALAVTVLASLAAACGGEPAATAAFPATPPPAPGGAGGPGGPVVEVVPATAGPPPLDPAADPRTPLGELRAGHLPIWSPDFDWAFPPEVCGSDWALDAIAEPTPGPNVEVLGDVAAAAALSVMRYEHLLSRALAAPGVLEQLCVAVATVGSARNDALELLAGHLRTGSRVVEPAGPPEEVTIVALGPTAALAVACVTPGYPGVIAADGTTRDDATRPLDGDPRPGAATTGEGTIPDGATAPARLQAYLLSTARGLEDTVTDISYRVAEFDHRPAGDCDGLGAWAGEWQRLAEGWAAEGQLWGPVGRTVTTGELCDSPPVGGPDECPRDWAR